MTFATAFQPDAFQNDAFQVWIEQASTVIGRRGRRRKRAFDFLPEPVLSSGVDDRGPRTSLLEGMAPPSRIAADFTAARAAMTRAIERMERERDDEDAFFLLMM